ncbi:MAG: hypothetical protein HY904_08575 [Deltaproteobacteria bacterium]|nr:hypothetical protein [Deltaproteobacteria bacterium]
MVAGAAALLQAVQQAGGGAPIPPTEVRDAFTRTGTAQGGNTAEHIGPQPDLAAAADAVVVCGNTRRDRTEVCDDGNATAGDGCSADCRSDEKCGNRVVDAVRTEACDDGNTVDGDGCSADCRSNETCGNGTVDPAVGEVCDDGNTSAGDGCAADCRSDETCGNGVVDDAADEQCDDGNTDDWDGCNRKCRKLPPGVPPGCTGATPWAPALLVLLRARRRRSPGRP